MATPNNAEGDDAPSSPVKLSKNQKRRLKQKAMKEATEEAKAVQKGIEKRQLVRQQMGRKTTTHEQHKFWDTQPVPQMQDDQTSENGPIEEPDFDNVRQEPYGLIADFEWVVCNMSDDTCIKEVYNLLSENYVEDDDNMFRFDYSEQFLEWALKPPGYFPEWHIGVRVKTTKKLVAFITGIPATVFVYGKSVKLAEINFLCVHKKLRSKRLAPVLIKEITRRVHLKDQWQAVYTAGIVLPKPVASCRYFHRSLNPKKLISVGFSHLPRRQTMAMAQKLYSLPAEPLTPGIRELRPGDLKEAAHLLREYLKKYHLYIHYSDEEFASWILPREGVVYAFVVENPETKKITDLISFYCLPSTIIGNKEYKTLKAAYSFYNVAGATPNTQLMKDALILAKQRDFDVFNALDIMENGEFLKDLRFGEGDGHLQYYLYNWKCPAMLSKNVGLVLL
eukprot:TRINITY_DN14673_c0_g1_i1.p1 TRINITY_DN14673_c0_g1~~TRINITY_DN14673_c0_g1_i1.p1  ORF type:complete len:456 (+),score=142.19 TRINITY_DN14673_c0_g1_i1:24-1370(+)